jgi:hypothetical protein
MAKLRPSSHRNSRQKSFPFAFQLASSFSSNHEVLLCFGKKVLDEKRRIKRCPGSVFLWANDFSGRLSDVSNSTSDWKGCHRTVWWRCRDLVRVHNVFSDRAFVWLSPHFRNYEVANQAPVCCLLPFDGRIGGASERAAVERLGGIGWAASDRKPASLVDVALGFAMHIVVHGQRFDAELVHLFEAW